MEELFGFLVEGLFEVFFSSLLFASVGFLYLYVRYRNRERVRRVLVKEYERSYTNAGQVVVLNSVAAIGALLVLGLLVLLLWHGLFA